MVIAFTELLGGFVRWLIKGCKTSLKKEIDGEYEATWGSSYDMENYIIGLSTAIVIIIIVALLVYFCVL